MDKETILLGLCGFLVLVWAAFERWREDRLLKSKDKQIETLLKEVHELGLMAKASTANEAQRVVELDRQSAMNPQQAFSSNSSAEEDSPSPSPRRFQVSGRPFTIYGLSPEIEEDFAKNVIEEVQNARPVSAG